MLIDDAPLEIRGAVDGKGGAAGQEARLARPVRFWQFPAVRRTIILYALALAIAATALQWLEYRYVTRAFSTEIYIGLLAAGFIALGAWAGHRLTPASRAARTEFQRNEAAIRSLGLTVRECEILDLLASGESNKELARRLGISPNTVKTHVAHVYDKLGVQRRVQAIEKARMLALIP
jgi:DNA-binding CsgD family transcriptional regulator